MPYNPSHQRQRLTPEELADSIQRVSAEIDTAINAHFDLMNHVYLHDAPLAQVNHSISLLRRAKKTLERGVEACGGQN